MSGITRFIMNLLGAITILLAIGALYVFYTQLIQPNNPLSSFVNLTSTIVGSGYNGTLVTTTVQQVNNSQTNTALEAYALSLINADRHQFNLTNVTLASEPSAQQHSDSMLTYDYFSHWDPYGLKPYMRYTLLGGTGSVSENVAYRSSMECSIVGCRGNINVQTALQQMEYDMMYNDSACCENLHRENILTPQHNEVSIGIAYNSSTVYFTEDFINDYINWSNLGISASNDEMNLAGTLLNGASFSSVEINLDKPVVNMSRAQLDNTSSYSSGPAIAGVVSNPIYYYTGVQTIVADHYSANGNKFDIAFNMHDTISKNGPGEYTVVVWLNDSSGSSFAGATYTIFVNSAGNVYVPSFA